MRAALWFLALFAIAVAAALFAGSNHGTVTLFWPPYRLDLSLNLFVMGALVLFMVAYLAVRAVASLLDLPAQARRWRVQRQERAIHEGLLDVLSHLVAGRYIRSRTAAQRVLQLQEALERAPGMASDAQRLRTLTHMLAAEAAHGLQDRSNRDDHAAQALAACSARSLQEMREGVLLRMTRWAFDDRDLQSAQKLLDDLPQGAARRTVALRLRFKIARAARHTVQALQAARLLAKHGAFSKWAADGIVRGLALELIQTSHDGAQLEQVWGQLDATERALPEVAMAAAERLLAVGGSVELAQDWLLPVWEQMLAREQVLSREQRVRLVMALQACFLQGPAQQVWLARVEAAQKSQPGDALLQYLAGILCMRLSLWGKAQQLLGQSRSLLRDAQLERQAWRALALLAEQREDPAAAMQAWRNAAN